jgi:hypothetical protein
VGAVLALVTGFGQALAACDVADHFLDVPEMVSGRLATHHAEYYQAARRFIGTTFVDSHCGGIISSPSANFIQPLQEPSGLRKPR